MGLGTRQSHNRALVALFTGLVSAFLSGCGGASDEIKVNSVSGQVTYKNQPLTDALVMFKPKNGAARVASGYTQSDGRFELVTSGASGSGAMPGEYDVLVIKVIEVDGLGNPVTPKAGGYDPAAGPQTRTTQKSMIPEKYNNPRAPLLSAVVSEGENHFTFDLAD